MKNPTDAQTTNEAITNFLTGALNLFWIGFLIMLAFGVAHGTAHAVPAFGYWQSFFIGWVTSVIIDSGTRNLDHRVKRLGIMVSKVSPDSVIETALRKLRAPLN